MSSNLWGENVVYSKYTQTVGTVLEDIILKSEHIFMEKLEKKDSIPICCHVMEYDDITPNCLVCHQCINQCQMTILHDIALL